MAVYSYQATDSKQSTVQGTIAGDSPHSARQELREKGLVVTRLKEIAKAHGAVSNGRLRSRRRATGRVANLFGEISTLLSVGVPLTESLDTLISQHTGWFRMRLMQLRDAVISGTGLADAMRRQPDLFDELSVSLAEVGENTGKLDETFGCLARFKRKSLEFKDRVLNALLYPAILLTTSIVVSVFLMSVVVPTLLENLTDMGKALPWPTRVLKGTSDFLLANGWWLIGLVIGSIALIMAGLSTDWGSRIKDTLLLKIPLLGTMIRQQETARISLVISTLMSSGLDLVRSLDIASRTSRNIPLRDSLARVSSEVRVGRELGDVMRRESFFPPLVGQVFSVGQKSGQLESMLLRLAEDYEQQVASRAGRLAVLIEPILIAFLSVVVGFILFATLLPILEAGNVL